jgi:hypothetical protein
MIFDRVPGHMGMEVPVHTQETIKNYLLYGFEPGGFVTSMLALDMERALTTADTGNRQMMWVIGQWIIQNAPTGSWGDYDTVRDWCVDTDGRRSRFVEQYKKQQMWESLQQTHQPPHYEF